MISSLLLITATVFSLVHSQESVSCDTVDAPDVTIGAGATVDDTEWSVDQMGFFTVTLCGGNTNVDWEMQLLDDAMNVLDTCSGTADCVAGDAGTLCISENTDGNLISGTLVITEVSDPAAAGTVTVSLMCNAETPEPVMSTTAMMMSTTAAMSTTMSSTDSFDSSSASDDSDDDNNDSDSDSDISDSATESPESLEDSVMVDGELLDDASAESDINGRSHFDAFEAEENAKNAMPFWQWVWVIVGVFVLINLGACYWIRGLRNEKRRRVSFDANPEIEIA